MLMADSLTARLWVEFGSPRAQLYSFWVSANACGVSGGWVTAGVWGFNGTRDLYGAC